MTYEYLIFAMLAAAFAAGTGTFISRRSRIKELRGLLEFTQQQLDELQDAFNRFQEAGEAAQARAADQARRIAWLESRLRRPKQTSAEILDEPILTETPRLSMTERRHRVVNLARRGKNAEAIAASLGLFRGEVELILSLDRAAIGAK